MPGLTDLCHCSVVYSGPRIQKVAKVCNAFSFVLLLPQINGSSPVATPLHHRRRAFATCFSLYGYAFAPIEAIPRLNGFSPVATPLQHLGEHASQCISIYAYAIAPLRRAYVSMPVPLWLQHYIIEASVHLYGFSSVSSPLHH